MNHTFFIIVSFHAIIFFNETFLWNFRLAEVDFQINMWDGFHILSYRYRPATAVEKEPPSLWIDIPRRNRSNGHPSAYGRCHSERRVLESWTYLFFCGRYLQLWSILCTLSTGNVAQILKYLNMKELAQSEFSTGFQSNPRPIEDRISSLCNVFWQAFCL